jgi:hypothetical protein
MKRLIYQVNIPLEGQNALYDFCENSVSNYCKKYDIDHIVQREMLLKISPNMKRTQRNKNGLMKLAGDALIIFEKENAFNYFDEYDQIAIIDSDIYVRDNAPNIFDELPEEYDFGGVLERDLPLSPGHKNKIVGYSRDMFKNKYISNVDWEWKDNIAAFMNMGMMLMNKSIVKYFNGQTPEEFIRRPEFTDLVDGIGLFKYSTDQVLLNYWLKKDKVRVKYLDWRWNGMYRGASDIKQAYFVHFFLKNQIPGKGKDISHIKKVL